MAKKSEFKITPTRPNISSTDSENMTVKAPRKLVLVLCVLLILLLIVTIILLVALCTKGFGSWEDKVCQTPQCIDAASRIAGYVDSNVNPCDDFYEYACGRYINSNPIPSGMNLISPISAIHIKLQTEQRRLLESPSDLDKLKIVKQAKIFYASCMNETQLTMMGIEPLKQYVQDKGGWALLQPNWNDTDFNLEDYIAAMAVDSKMYMLPSDKSPVLVTTTIWANPNNTNENIMMLAEGALPLVNPEYYRRPLTHNPKLKMQERRKLYLAEALGGDPVKLKPKVQQMIEFERELAMITVLKSDMADAKLMTIEQANKKYEGIDFLRLVNGYLKVVSKKVTKMDVIGIFTEDYFIKLGQLLQKTPKVIQSSYVMSGSLDHFVEYTDTKTRRYGQVNAPEPPRYITCTSVVNFAFPNAMARMYVAAFRKDGRGGIQDLVQRIRESFKNNINRASWLDENTRKSALDKLKTLREDIAYPDFILNDTALNNQMNGLENLQSDQFLGNAVKVYRAEFMSQMELLETPAVNGQWPLPPVMVNAFYVLTSNLMVVPVGILQVPVFDTDGPQALNYGAMGMVLGHEITHGFDSIGRHFGPNGNKREWWSPTALSNFNARADCVRKQYSNITIKWLNRKVNGNLTLSENIADMGGVKQAFAAYQNWVSANGKELPLPGLKLTPDQLFFIGFSQFYCENSYLWILDVQAATDSHTTNRERVLGTLMNFEEFSNAYKCPSGSKMNPKHKCSVW